MEDQKMKDPAPRGSADRVNRYEINSKYFGVKRIQNPAAEVKEFTPLHRFFGGAQDD